MMKKILGLWGLVLCSVVWSSSYAVTIDPDAYPCQDLSNVFSGIVLTAVNQDGSTESVYSRYAPALASTGEYVFAHDMSDPSWGDGIWEFLRIDFLSGASEVSLDFIGNDPLDMNAYLVAFDSSQNYLGHDCFSGALGLGCCTTLSLSISNIAYVVALGDPLGNITDYASIVSSGGDAQSWSLDNLNYTASIPEPSTVLLFGAGTMVLAGVRSRRKSDSM